MNVTLRSAALVLLAGISYGATAPIIKLAHGAGFTWQQITAGQSTYGVLLFLLALAVVRLRGQRWQRLAPRQLLKLLGTGVVTCCTCALYSIALGYLPVAVALTLLFQFTWVGVLIQVIATQRAPSKAEVASAAIVLVGTLAASGLLSTELTIDYHPIGMACGMGSAVSCALFMFFTSRVETDLPTIQRGLVICCGSAILAYTLCPTYLIDGVVLAQAPFGAPQGLFALLLPVILFGLGGPHLPTGIVSILASAELPTSIVLSLVMLSEPIDAIQAAGVITILVGVVVSQAPTLAELWGQRKQGGPPQPR